MVGREMSRIPSLRQALPKDLKALQFPQRPPLDLEALAKRYPLMDYITTYGIESHQLERNYLTTLLVARNCEGLLDSLQHTPLATDLSQCEPLAVTQHPRHSLAEQGLKKRQVLSAAATDHTSLGKIERLGDISRALPIELARMVTTPDLFINRVVTRQINIRENLDNKTSATARKSNVHEAPASGAPTKLTQRALVLVDVTKSMDTRDGRGVVAAGLGLAYLRRAAARGGALHVAPFTTHLTGIFSGEGREGLTRLTKELLNLQNSGVTNIQRSLEEAADTILQKGDFEHDDVVLLSDGLSRLTERPASLRRLHTFLLGNHEERTEQGLHDILELKKQRTTLIQWSETFDELKGDELRELTTLSASDFAHVKELAYRYLRTFDGHSEEHKRVLSAIQHLLSHTRCADVSLSKLSVEIGRAIHPRRWQSLPPSPRGAGGSGGSIAEHVNAPAEEPVEHGASGDSSSVRLHWGRTGLPSTNQNLLFKKIYDVLCTLGRKVVHFLRSHR